MIVRIGMLIGLLSILVGAIGTPSVARAASSDTLPLYVEILSVVGRAEVVIAPDTSWREAREGMELRSGDSIKAYEESSVEIAFDEDKVVRIEANSYVTVLLKEGEKIELVNGEVYATVKNLPAGSSFEIRTPTGIAGARGTDWLTRADAEKTVVEAYEDMPYIRAIEKDGTVSREEVRIAPGYRTTVPRYHSPERPVRIPDREVERWRSWKSDLKPRLDTAVTKRAAAGKRLGGDRPAVKKEGVSPSSFKTGKRDVGGTLTDPHKGQRSRTEAPDAAFDRRVPAAADRATGSRRSFTDDSGSMKRPSRAAGIDKTQPARSSMPRAVSTRPAPAAKPGNRQPVPGSANQRKQQAPKPAIARPGPARR